MMGKKLVLVASVLVGSLTIGGVAGAATTAYYIEYMDNMKPMVTAAVDKTFNQKFDDQDSAIYHGTISIAYSEMDSVQKQATQYAVDQVNKYASDKTQHNANEIAKHGQEILKEIEAHIDQELKDRTSGFYQLPSDGPKG
ncbi:MAG TPA: hypothetical protein VFH42_00245 [Sporolactobacillaceae bacterium]|nr:hypothetical protein [Sporolactobacillaceae bacterium]